MLHRLPKHPADWADLIADIGSPSTAEIARALGVSRRTVERWNHVGAPRTALLSVWWLSRWGHDLWDCEMANRTRQALDTNRMLWSAVAELQRQKRRGITLMASNAINGAAANEPRFLVDQGTNRSRGDRGQRRITSYGSYRNGPSAAPPPPGTHDVHGYRPMNTVLRMD